MKLVVINPEVILEPPYKDADTEFKISFVSTDKTKQTHPTAGYGFED